MDASPYRQVSAAPTLPGGAHAAGHVGEFDVAALYEGPLATAAIRKAMEEKRAQEAAARYSQV